jgi:epoxyqueuosine reductase
MTLDNRIRNAAAGLGADYFGVADLIPARNFIRMMGGEQIARFPAGISLGIRLLDSLVDLLPERHLRQASVLYRHHAYDVVNLKLDQISLGIANIIQNCGYSAMPVPSSLRVDDGKISGSISHKLVAARAGLGWIGKNCLLITPDHGPRVRWTTVLTDAPLRPTGEPADPQCGECGICVAACPAGAIHGRSFIPTEPREARMDAEACDLYFKKMKEENGIAVCGMCLYACPYGRQRH